MVQKEHGFFKNIEVSEYCWVASLNPTYALITQEWTMPGIIRVEKIIKGEKS
jgi:hypothetical protein